MPAAIRMKQWLASCTHTETVTRRYREGRVSARLCFGWGCVHCVVQIWWNSCLLQCWLHKAQPTTHPKHSPISLNLSLPHVVFLTMEEECEDDDNPSPQARQEEKENTSIPLSSPIAVTVLLKYFKRVFFQDTNQRNTTKMKTLTCIQKHDVRMTLTTTHAQTGLAAGAAFFLCYLPFTEQWDRVTVDEHGSEGLEFC